MQSIYFTPEHDTFRDQVRRFVDEEVRPNADAWEEAGAVPREIFRKMGELGFFGTRYPEEYGGADWDTFSTVVLAKRGDHARFDCRYRNALATEWYHDNRLLSNGTDNTK